MLSDPPSHGDAVVFYVVADDVNGGKDSARMMLVMGEEYPTFKETPDFNIYPGDTLAFDPMDYIIWGPTIDTSKIRFSASQIDAFLRGKVENGIVKSFVGPVPRSIVTSDEIIVYIDYNEQRITWEIPAIVHARKNNAPAISTIPVQTAESANSAFQSLKLSDYVQDDYTPADQLFYYIEDADHISVTIDNGVLQASKLEADWVGSDTISLIAEDYDYLQDTIQIVFSVITDEAPVIKPIPSQSITIGGSFSGISLSGYVDDADTPDDHITWEALAGSKLTVNLTGSVATVDVIDPNWTGKDSVRFVAVDEDGFSDTTWVTFSVGLVSGITALEEFGINLWPNPVRESLKVELSESFAEGTLNISVIDMQGG